MTSNKKFGLGKGLSALIPEESIDIENNEKKVSKISINLIKPNKDQPRQFFDSEKISSLASSIREHGIIQPIILKKEDSNYKIIAGERRWRAAKSIGLREVPAIVMDMNDRKVLEISLIENIQREDLNPIEEAEAYKKLIEDFNLTQEDLSKRIGKSRTAISNSMRLLNLDNRVKKLLIEGTISEGHGRVLLALHDKNHQYEFAKKIIEESLSVRDTEKIIRNLGKSKKKNKKPLNPYYKDIKNKLENYFGTKVSIKDNKNKGKIEIEYYSEEDLQRILEIIGY